MRDPKYSLMQGSLVCVGVGMTLGSHLTPLSRSYIESADVVFAAPSAVQLQAATPIAQRTDGTLGLITMCCGGGLGTGTIIERL